MRGFLFVVLLLIPWYVGFELAEMRHQGLPVAIPSSLSHIDGSEATEHTNEGSMQQAHVLSAQNQRPQIRSRAQDASDESRNDNQPLVDKKDQGKENIHTAQNVEILESVIIPSETKVLNQQEQDEDANRGFRHNDILRAHNVARAEVGVPSLVWSETLAQSAREWGDVLVSRQCAISHDPNTPYGENILSSWVTGGTHTGLINSPEDVVSSWTNEKTSYHHKDNTCTYGEKCGHYTQVVWKDSTEIGCSVHTCFAEGRQTDVWVCRYNPPGNNGSRPY